MDRVFSLAEACALLPDLLAHAEDLVRTRADLAEMAAELTHGRTSPREGVADAKALEARLSEQLACCAARGLQVKGWAWHRTDLGFAGRRPL